MSYLFAWVSSRSKSQLCFEMQLKCLSTNKKTRLLLLLPNANKGQVMGLGVQNRGSPRFQELQL